MTETFVSDPQFAPMSDIHAEQTVLGSMMISEKSAEDALDVLSPADFYDPRHNLLAQTIADRLHCEPIEPVAMQAHLLKDGVLDQVGGDSYLSDLRTQYVSSIDWYVRRVSELAKRRRVEEDITRAHQVIRNPGLDVEEAISQVDAIVIDTTTADAPAAAANFDDDLDALFESLRSPDPHAGISTGLPSLDAVVGRLKPGQLVTIAARPGMGKTVLAAEIARSAAWHQAESVLFCTLEMSRVEMQKRMITAEADVLLQKMVNPPANGLPDGDMDKLAAVRRRTDGALLSLYAHNNISVQSIRTQAKRLQRTVGIGLIVVDYLQLMTPDKRIENRAQEVAEISRGLKKLAIEMGVPIVAAAQLNRLSEGRADKRPQLSDMRESGSIEQDSDIVVLLHREDYYGNVERSGEIDLIVAKNRNGATDTVMAAAQLHMARIVDMG